MNHTSVLALAAFLAAAPVAAQPKGEGPAGPGPIGPGPIGPATGPIGPARSAQARWIGPMEIGPMKIGPCRTSPSSTASFRSMKPAMLDAVAEAPMLAARAQDDRRQPGVRLRPGQGDREAERRDREAELREREREREAQWYSEGQNAADEYRWDRALGYFNRVVELKGSKVDAALYWKAFSQNRLGQRTEALATIGELSKNYPNSPLSQAGDGARSRGASATSDSRSVPRTRPTTRSS